MNRARQNPWAVVAVVLLPLLALGILLASLWNPVDRLDTVQAAIVNEDEPVEVDGQTVPLGRQLTAGLVGGAPDSDVNYDWTITDADGAADGLADGTYAAVVTIPEDFSAAATSFGADDPSDARQATIDISTPPGGRVVDDALARIVATTATSVMGSTLTETYVDNVLIGFDQLSDGIGQAADGAHQLADGAGEAASGADDLADGAGQLADGVDQYADGVGEAADGADQLADGVGRYASGVGEAAEGADQLADGVSRYADGVSSAADGADDLADGADQLSDGATGLAEGARTSADGAGKLATGAEELASGAGDLSDGLKTFDQSLAAIAGLPAIADLPATTQEAAEGAQGAADLLADYIRTTQALNGCPLPPAQSGIPECDSLLIVIGVQAGLQESATDTLESVGKPGKTAKDASGTYKLTQGLAELSAGAGDLSDGASGLATGADQLSTGTDGLATGLDELATGAEQLATGVDGLATGASGLADGVGQLDTGAQGLVTGASGLADGVGQLDTGAQGLATGANGLASGFVQLESGANELSTGASGVADGTDGLADGVGQLASGSDDLASGLDDAVDGIPTYSEDERQHLSSVVADPVAAPGVDDLSTGATGPLFAVVALWLGALALMTVFPPVVAHALGSTRSALRLTLSAGAVPAAIGAGTGAVIGAILAAVEDVSAGGWIAAIAVGALVSVTFVATHLGFLGWLGNVGRGISLLITVLLIATSVVATVPGVLVGLEDFLPTGAAQDALSAVVIPEVGGLGGAVVLLVLWLLVGLGLGVGAAARARRTRVAALLRG